MTLCELYGKCLAEYWNKDRFVVSGWKEEVEKYANRHILPVFGGMECDTIGPRAIKAWHQNLENTPTTANRCLEVLSRIFQFGQEEELLPIGTNPCKLVKAYPEKERSRYASKDEIAKIAEAANKLRKEYPYEVALCELVALTGARPRSLMRVRRDELAIHDGVGILRFVGKSTHQTGEHETVVVPPIALKSLMALPPREDGRLIGEIAYRRVWERIREMAGCPDLWLRDLRRTFATHGFADGVSLDEMREVLNHRSIQTTTRYAKILPIAKMNAACSVSKKMTALMRQPTR
jgi:integrase